MVVKLAKQEIDPSSSKSTPLKGLRLTGPLTLSVCLLILGAIKEILNFFLSKGLTESASSMWCNTPFWKLLVEIMGEQRLHGSFLGKRSMGFDFLWI